MLKGLSERKRFVIKYAFRAMISLLLIFGGLLLFKELYFDHDPEYWIERFYGNSLKIHLIYVASEVFFGIFPPELFMIWAINAGDTTSYVINILYFAVVSVIAGHIAFWGGKYLAKAYGRRFKKSNYISKYLPIVKKFGGLLILIAAFTPLPWATISLVMGTIDYNYRKFALISLARILRFAINGFLIFKTGSLFF
jgi:membrane protein DedA with SNARE-associated domain